MISYILPSFIIVVITMLGLVAVCYGFEKLLMEYGWIEKTIGFFLVAIPFTFLLAGMRWAEQTQVENKPVQVKTTNIDTKQIPVQLEVTNIIFQK